jgi:hypothetical protein
MSDLVEAMRELVSNHDFLVAKNRRLQNDIDLYQSALKILCMQRELKWTVEEINRASKEYRVVSVHGSGVDLIDLGGKGGSNE